MGEATLPIFYQRKLTQFATDMLPPLNTSASGQRVCVGLEREFMTCLSNYGLDFGKEKCSAEKVNLQECQHHFKSKARTIAMAAEREKQGKEPIPKGPAHLHATPFY